MRSRWAVLVLLLVGCGDSSGSMNAPKAGSGSMPGDGDGDPAGDGDVDAPDDSDAATGPGVDGVSFANEVQPTFIGACNYCHHPDNAVMVDLSRPFDPDVGIIGRDNTWTEAAATLLVDPGNLDNSFLLDKVARDDLDPHVEGEPMPWNIPRLTPDEVTAVRTWIDAGAHDDDFYRAEVAPIFGDGVSLGSKGGKCGYCHYPEAENIPDLTNPFDAERGVIDIVGIRGRVLVVPGDADASFLVQKVEEAELDSSLGLPMPLHSDPLTDEEIDAIERWILAGAPDN